jgi:biotin-(acetyl-CoA carboxylase) ligase
MNFVKMMEARGINLENLSDYEFSVLLHAIPQEQERRSRVKREQLIAEYTDKINNLINELQEQGLTLSYNGESFGKYEFEIG